MRRRKRTEFFKLCGFCFPTIIINLISICTQHTASAIHLEERMEVVRKVLREVPLIDGWVHVGHKSKAALNYRLLGSLASPRVGVACFMFWMEKVLWMVSGVERGWLRWTGPRLRGLRRIAPCVAVKLFQF